MKAAVKKDLKEKHDTKLLKDVQKMLEDMENVDFTKELKSIRDKIRLLIEVKRAIDNEGHMKQSIEFLEYLFNRVCELENSENNGNEIHSLTKNIEYPITIMWESKLMLQSRVNAAKKFK
jgi:hypothetical protein